MRYALDIDGCLCDFDVGFARECNQIWPGRLHPTGHHTRWDWADVGLTKEDVDKVWERIVKVPNFWLSLPGYPENVRAVATQRIRHPEDEIFYVTARKSTVGMPTMHQTQTWLQQCGIGGLGTAVIVDQLSDKSLIFNALNCDANVDDKLEAVVQHARRTKGAFLLSRPWNERGRPSTIAVVGSLEEFFRKAGINVTSSK